MKHNWNRIPLGKVIKYRNGFITINDFQKYKLCRVQTKAQGVVLREEKEGIEIKTKEQQICKANDLIFAEMDARFGGYGIIPDELDGAIVSSHYFLYEINQAVIEKRFLEYCLKQSWFLSQVEAKGSTNYAAIRPYQVLDYEVPLPSLPEQQRIVSRIESVKHKIEEIKKLRAEQNKDLNNLAYSKYVELIDGVEWLPMSEVAPIVRREVAIKENEIYPELGIRSFGKGTFHKPSLSGLEVGTKTLYQIKAGDLMFSNVFAWEGAIAVAKEEDDNRFGSHRFISCVVKSEIAIAEFLCFHFLTEKGLEDINLASPGGAGRNKTLGLDKLMKIKVPVPALNEQREFVSLLHQITETKAIHHQTQQELNELLPSLLDKAFKGEL